MYTHYIGGSVHLIIYYSSIFPAILDQMAAATMFSLWLPRGVVASAPDFERADEGSILTAGLCFKSGKSECNNSGYKLTGLTWWP